jgi:hypothetical protein
LSVLDKEGLDMLSYFFNMWCGKKMPCSNGCNLHRLAPSATELWPDTSGIPHRPSYMPLGRHDIENSSGVFPSVVASHSLECGSGHSVDLEIGKQLFITGFGL